MSQIRHLRILINSIYILPDSCLALSDVFDYTKAHETVIVFQIAGVKAVYSFLFLFLLL